GALGPLLGQGDTAETEDLVAGSTRQGCELGLEAGAVDDAVDLVLLPVDDRALLGDPLDPGGTVDRRDIGVVEGMQVLVVAAWSPGSCPFGRAASPALAHGRSRDLWAGCLARRRPTACAGTRRPASPTRRAAADTGSRSPRRR